MSESDADTDMDVGLDLDYDLDKDIEMMNREMKKNVNVQLNMDNIAKDWDLLHIDKAVHMKKNYKLRDHLIEAIDMKEASERGEDCLEKATKLIKATDKITVDAKLSTTAWLDAQVLHTTSIVLKNSVDIYVSRISDFNVDEYTENILAYVRANYEGNIRGKWCTLEKIAEQTVNTTPSFYWQSGAIEDPGIVRPVQRQARVRENIVTQPAKQPKNVSELGEETTMETQLRQIMKILGNVYKENKTPVSFFEFVLNPWSFSESTENIFFLSHLIKEGSVFLKMDKYHLPVITPNADRTIHDRTNFIRQQMAITLDLGKWKELVDAFDIQRPMIPSRGDFSEKK